LIKQISVSTWGQGLYDITDNVNRIMERRGRIDSGLCTLFIPHTSASLIVQENADPSARKDLENWLNRLVPEDDALYTHVAEDTDDMPAHVKSMLTQTSLSIPIANSAMVLGTWQGIYLFEHRRRPHRRDVMVHLHIDSLKDETGA